MTIKPSQEIALEALVSISENVAVLATGIGVQPDKIAISKINGSASVDVTFTVVTSTDEPRDHVGFMVSLSSNGSAITVTSNDGLVAAAGTGNKILYGRTDSSGLFNLTVSGTTGDVVSIVCTSMTSTPKTQTGTVTIPAA